jgi:mannose-1-phosphate guanylyltransferase
MRYAVIMAGGSGTRLWPMSTHDLPKQLIPFIHGRSLIEVAMERLDGLLPADQCYICAGQAHQQAILDRVSGMTTERFYGEPVGRDTLNAVGLPAAERLAQDPEAVIAVFTADHLIEPIELFQQRVTVGFEVAEQQPNTLVTFGIKPTQPATGYGYVHLGEALDGFDYARRTVAFKEKPDHHTARRYVESGEYLWNSGMFVWRAATLMAAIEKFAPENHAGLMRLGEGWHTPDRQKLLDEIYPALPKISVDYAVMEPASTDDQFSVATVEMPLRWLDVGSWTSYARTCDEDDGANALGAGATALIDTTNTIIASSDEKHLIATIGVKDLIIVHTPNATLVCHQDDEQSIKQLHAMIKEQYGDKYV